MKEININNLIRENIRWLKPYSSARDEYSGEDAVFLDANENPYNDPLNRYPDPLQMELKKKIGEIKKISSKRIFLGNGSDEAIDLLIRVFCEPGRDNIVSIDPTYGMYKVCADINNVNYNKVSLTPEFELDVASILRATNVNTKLLFLCSPNNPTSNSFDKNDLIELFEKFTGIVVLDEAYIDFSNNASKLSLLSKYQNLVILQTFSKAWGLAGIRLGMAFADPLIIQTMNKIKYPYNINKLTAQKALDSLSNIKQKDKWVNNIQEERNRIAKELLSFDFTEKVFPSDANFLLVKFSNVNKIFNYLIQQKIVLRDRSKENHCEGCLRITIGTKQENNTLLKGLKEYAINNL